MNQECPDLFFRLRETSGSENQSLPWTSRGIQVKYWPMMLLFIHRHYVLNYPIFYDQWALSPQSVSAIYRYISHWLWQEVENFLMQIISHMTDENQFLNRGISLSLRKPTRGNIYGRQPQSLLTLFSVKIAADQLINLSAILFAESGFEQQVSAK